MKRTAVIGNSHSIAIRRALISRFPERFGNECFGLLHTWRIENKSTEVGTLGTLIGSAVGKEFVVELDKFDQFVVSAGGWWAARNEALSASHPLAYISKIEWDKDSATKPRTARSVSHTLFEEVIKAWVADTSIIKLVKYICEHSSCRIILQPWPAPNRELKSDPKWLINIWYGEYGAIAWRDFFKSQRRALETLVGAIGNNVVLLDYPLEDIKEDGFMSASLCDTDPFHGNVKYGNLVVDQLTTVI